MVDRVGADLRDYSRAHMVYALFMMGFGSGHRLRRTLGASRDNALTVDAMCARYMTGGDDGGQGPYDAGFRYGWLFEPMSKGDENTVERGSVESEKKPL